VTDARSDSVRTRVQVTHDGGLHARPASRVAKCASEFRSDIHLILLSTPIEMSTPAGTRADAKNIMDIMLLAAPTGTEIEIEAEGPDAEAAVERLEALFKDRFGLS
jgi:phosphocarrier protein